MLQKMLPICDDMGLCVRKAYGVGTRIYCYINRADAKDSSGDVLVIDEGRNIDSFFLYLEKYDSDKRIKENLIELSKYIGTLEKKKG